MPTFRVQLRLAINENTLAYKWSNTFFLDAANASVAASAGITLWDTTWRKAHSTLSFCYEVYATDLLPGTVNYQLTGHLLTANIFGTIPTSGDFMPAFVVARIDLNVPNSRPSRKFIRAPFTEASVSTDNLIGAALTGVQDAANGLVAAGVRDEGGALISSVSIKGVTSRRLGKFAYTAVPGKPVVVP